MLLRSSSSPILKTLISVSAEATSPGSANHHLIHLPTSAASLPPRTRSCSTTLARTVSESNISDLLTRPSSFPKIRRKERVTIIENDEDAEEDEKSTIDPVWAPCHALSLSPPSLAVQTDHGGRSDTLLLDEGCVGDGGSGGRICGGGGGGSGSNDSDSNKSTDVYYQQMIQAHPSNPLLLGNYAKYLKEVRGDLGKAEEYCERAILANQEEDGGVLSMYADIVWERSKDAERAEAYFDRAVQAAPEDCYVAASYARFLWDAEEKEEEEEGKNDETTSKGKESVAASRPLPSSSFFHGQATSTPIAAAS